MRKKDYLDNKNLKKKLNNIKYYLYYIVKSIIIRLRKIRKIRFGIAIKEIERWWKKIISLDFKRKVRLVIFIKRRIQKVNLFYKRQ